MIALIVEALPVIALGVAEVAGWVWYRTLGR